MPFGSQRGQGRLRALVPVALAVTALTSVPLPGHALGLSQPTPPTLDPTYGLPLPKHAARTAKTGPEASWIWANQTTDNQTITLRAAFILDRLPKTAVLHITADNFFTLYVNGQQVDASKPDPNDDLVWKHVHHVNIVRYLTTGKNVLAVRAVNAGGPAGMIAALYLDGKPALRTDDKWKVSQSASLPDDWTATNYDDSAWQPATVEAPVNGGAWEGGLDGWPGYSADVPYLAHITLNPVAPFDIHNGAGTIIRIVGGTIRSIMDSPFFSLVRLAPAGSNDPPSVVLDFGKELAGRLQIAEVDPAITQAGTGGPVTVQVGTGESREEAIKSPWGGVHSLNVIAGKPGSPPSYAFSPYSAFRYAKLTFLPPSGSQGSAQILEISVTFDHKYYPVQYLGSFSCSDELLTRIWYTGAYTAHLCMQEDIWDAPKRDRARWMGDLHVSGEVINTVFADRFLMEQTMQRLRDDAQGGQPATSPPRSHVNGIPGYSCAWIAGLADFHRHIGDYDYLRRQHDLLISMLEYFRGELDDRGVFANKRGAWPFVDWSPDFNGDGPLARATTHFFLVKAVREAVFLLQEMGDTDNATRYSIWADQLTAAAQQYLLDSTTQTFGARRQENAMAIVSGVATPEQTQAIYAAILKPGSPAWSQVATPYYNAYVIAAMSLAGHTAETLPFLRDYWGGMLSEGATSFWEGYDPSWEKDDFHAHLQADNGTGYFVSLCHGWSSGPTSWLTERVLGVRPTGGGFKTAEIVPDLGDLAWAEGDVPTPNGLLHVRVEKQNGGVTLSLSLPKGVIATVGLPGQSLLLNGHPVPATRQEAGRVYLQLNSGGRYTLVGR